LGLIIKLAVVAILDLKYIKKTKKTRKLRRRQYKEHSIFLAKDSLLTVDVLVILYSHSALYIVADDLSI